jgi:hypothetical protein
MRMLKAFWFVVTLLCAIALTMLASGKYRSMFPRGISTISAIKSIKAADMETTAWLDKYNREHHKDLR